ncbi:MAG: hypothetical protein M1546_12060 [Chloroflexi bacterium]|nr:hypothetical protein [Chloroflexota bacterium]
MAQRGSNAAKSHLQGTKASFDSHARPKPHRIPFRWGALTALLVAFVLLCNASIGRADQRQSPAFPNDAASIAQHPRQGLNVSHMDNQLLQLARDSGSTHDRIDFPMADIQPARDQWNWSYYDALVTAESAYGLQVLGVLTAPPIWAAPVNMIPSGLDLPWNDPGNLWAQHVYQVALHFKDRIHAWQIWNEPDLDKYWPGPPGAANLRERMRPFARLMKVSYQAIKAANPNAVVVTAGFLYRVGASDQGQPRVIALWQELNADPEGTANHYFFDAVALHLYDGGTCEVPGPYYYDVVNDFRANMVAWVGDHPLWITESGIRQVEQRGFGVLPPSTDRYATLDEAASYVLQNYAYALYQDTQRYYYFRTRDDGGVENWGLMRGDNSPRPAYTAYQIAAQYLPYTYTFATRVWSPSDQSGPVSRISFWGTPLGRVSVVWNIGAAAQTYVFASRIPTVTQVVQRSDGNGWDVSTRVAPDKRFTLTLEAAPNFNFRPERDMCLVASRPAIFIESDLVPPTATLNALPVTTTQTALPLAWSGSDDLSGVWSYQLQYRVNDGAWAILRSWTSETTFTFNGQAGLRYSFRVRARDNVGNEQDWESANVVSTSIVPTGTWTSAAYLPFVSHAPAPICADPIVNGGFEQDGGWEINPTPYPATYTLSSAHGGIRAMQTGIALDASDPPTLTFSSISQTLQLPAGTSLSLQLWCAAQTQDTDDLFYVRLWDQYGTLHTLAETFTAVPGWQSLSFDLTPYAGQPITLLLGTRNDGDGLRSVAYYDDIVLDCD